MRLADQTGAVIEVFPLYCQELRNACHILVNMFFRLIRKAVAKSNCQLCHVSLWDHMEWLRSHQPYFLKFYIGDFTENLYSFPILVKISQKLQALHVKTYIHYDSISLFVINVQVMWYLSINKIHVRSIPEHKILWHFMCFECI